MYVSYGHSWIFERPEDNEGSEDPKKRNRFRRSLNILQAKQIAKMGKTMDTAEDATCSRFLFKALIDMARRP